MGVSRDCGHFTVSLNISGGLHDTPDSPAGTDKSFRESAAKELIKIKNKHERALLDEWCAVIGWDEEKAAAASAAVKQERQELFAQDRAGRDEKNQRRRAAGA